MAQEEVDGLRAQLAKLEGELEVLLLPRDPLDERSIMLEVHSCCIICLSTIVLLITKRVCNENASHMTCGKLPRDPLDERSTILEVRIFYSPAASHASALLCC